jgi:hypothetical protein
MLRPLAGLAVAAMLLVPSFAFADDWLAAQLRGDVFVYVDNQWQPLKRGGIVPDTEMIRTMASGHATFTRGQETVEVEPNTQLQILDKGHAKPFTTVKQYFGSISVEAQVENVQHFAVDTPFLAAVVKGTRFTVTSGKTGSSVSVQRGHVAVEDFHGHSHTLLSVGQTATVDVVKTDGQIVVGGTGDLPPVTDAKGKPVIDTTSAVGPENISHGLVNADIGNGHGVTVGIGPNNDVASVGLGGDGGLVHLSVVGPGGSDDQGQDGNDHGEDGDSQGDHHGGGLLNVNLGMLHIGL